MHLSVSVLRAGFARLRFAPAQPRNRERQLGLAGRARIATSSGRAVTPVHPRAAVRAAARSLVVPVAGAGPVSLDLSRGSCVSWTRRAADGLRAAREGSAAAWRA